MATSDDVTEIKLRDDNAIEVGKDIVHRGWAILRAKNSTGHSIAVSASPAECDALIAAIGRALGRPAPASPRYAPSDELRFIGPICAALAAAGATQEQALDAITKAMQDYRAKAVKLALEQTRPMVVVLDGAAHGEQGATVPRAGVEALRDELVDFQKRYVLGGMTETRVDRIVTMVDALLAAPATQTEKG